MIGLVSNTVQLDGAAGAGATGGGFDVTWTFGGGCVTTVCWAGGDVTRCGGGAGACCVAGGVGAGTVGDGVGVGLELGESDGSGFEAVPAPGGDALSH